LIGFVEAYCQWMYRILGHVFLLRKVFPRELKIIFSMLPLRRRIRFSYALPLLATRPSVRALVR
jgi:hypothetical protein